MAHHPRLDDLFSPCELLSVTTRRHLATLLMVPGRAPAVLSDDLRAAPLPSSADASRTVGRVIEEGLTPSVLAALAPRRLRDVVPALASAGSLAAGFDGRSARVLDALAANGIGTGDVEGFAACTIAQVRAWPGVGPAVAAALVGVALGAGTQALADGADAGPPDQNGLPTAVDEPLLAALDRVLAAAGDERDLGVFELRCLRLRGPGGAERPTMAQVGDALGIVYERVRQLQRRAEARVSAAAARDPELAVEARNLRAEIGEATHLPAIIEALSERGLPPPPDTRSMLLVWMAGPYHPIDGHAGWMAVDPGELLAETAEVLAEDGGVRPLDDVEQDLIAVGLTPGAVAAWVDRQPVRRFHDLVVATNGSVAQVVERAIEANGGALAVADLEQWVTAAGADGDRLVEALARDRRFLQVGPDSYELAEWGGVPYQREAGPPRPPAPPGAAEVLTLDFGPSLDGPVDRSGASRLDGRTA